MYRLPVYGHIAKTWLASTTLLCLNGLKSSLMLTRGPFLIWRVPKKRLGVMGPFSADLGLGDAAAPWFDETLGFGLNEEAFTFRRAAAVGDVGTSVRGVAEEDPEVL